jgi:hypothetical protein
MPMSARDLRTIEGTPHTLPLFEDPSRFDFMTGEQAHREPAPEDLVLEVYSSATLHAHALAAATMRHTSVRERWALRQLIEIEEERKELAAQLLDKVWGVSLAA